MMARGYFALILHAHLPFVRHPDDPTVMEERWFYEAITGTYLPLLQMFEGLATDGVPFRCTVSLSPPLITMLTDDLLRGAGPAALVGDDIYLELHDLTALQRIGESCDKVRRPGATERSGGQVADHGGIVQHDQTWCDRSDPGDGS